MSNKIYELREKLMRELEMLSDEKALSADKLDHIDKLSHAIKCIDTICAMEDSKYSRDDGNSYRRNRSYNSYADGRSMGYPMPAPYMPNMSYENSYNSYAYAQNGSSQHDGRGELMYRLEDMLKMAQTEKEREAIRMCMNKLNG